MRIERRRAHRLTADLLVNKFIDGTPHVARLVEVSTHGCVLERLLEPTSERDVYPLEFALPGALGGMRMWLWAKPVWNRDERTAMRFVGLDPIDRATLAKLAASLA